MDWGSQVERDILLQKSLTMVKEALAESDLDSETIERYDANYQIVLHAMTDGALERHSVHCKGIKFYASNELLTQAFFEKYPGARQILKPTAQLKGVFDRDGVLHLDGGGVLFGRPVPLSVFFAHEVTHSIDGNGHEISTSSQWVEAWSAERNSELFGRNGRVKASEGFAEFGQWVLGAELSREQMRSVMPKCLTVWEDNRL